MHSASETRSPVGAVTSPPTDMAISSTHPTLSAPLINNEDHTEDSGDNSLEADVVHNSDELPPFHRKNSSTAPSIATSLVVHTVDKSARDTTTMDAPSVNSAPHIRWQGAPSTPPAAMGNGMNIVDVIVPVDASASESLQERIHPDSAKGKEREDDASTYATARSRLSFHSFFTRSTGMQSHNGATWRRAFNLTMNSGFGSGAPRGLGKYVGVREGRESGGYLPAETGVGRTGKGPAPVPAGLIAALGLKTKKSYLADAKKQVRDLIDEVAELDRKVAELERFDGVRLSSMKLRRKLRQHRSEVDGLGKSFVADFDWKEKFTEDRREWFKMWVEQQWDNLRWYGEELDKMKTMMKEYDDLSEKEAMKTWQGKSKEEFDSMVAVMQQLQNLMRTMAHGPEKQQKCQDAMKKLLIRFVALERDIQFHERKNNLWFPKELIRRYDTFEVVERSLKALMDDERSLERSISAWSMRRNSARTTEEDFKQYLTDLFRLCQERYPIEEGGEEVMASVGQGPAMKIQHEGTITAYDLSRIVT